MTGQYKENLIKWLTGNFTPGNKPTEVVEQALSDFQEVNVFKEFLSTYYTTTNVGVKKTIKNPLNGNVVVLGYDNDNLRSIMVVFDGSLNPLQLITAYNSGTQFKNILNIGCGEDGNFFLIENTGSNIRFVMCNNIAAADVTGTFRVILRKSYNVGGNLTNLSEVATIIKYPGLSKYLVVGGSETNKINIATEIVVNVGMANEYNNFTFGTTPEYLTFQDIYYTLNGENIEFNIAASGNSSSEAYNELKNTDYTINTSTYALETPSVKAVKTNYNEAYLVTYDWNTYKYNFYHFNNGTNTLLGSYQTDGGSVVPRISGWSIGRINDVIYGIVLGDYDSNNYQIRAFTIINDNLQTSGLSEGISHGVAFFNMIMTATNSFDLYNFIYAFGNLTVKSYLVYNESRYNGQAYVDYNYFVPEYGMLSNDNGKLFARSLYNFTILNETSTAVINVPNNFVNDIEFKPYLYGETNSLLIAGNTFEEKNIYENLLINFNNSINILNDDLYMRTPSARLNNSISNTLDYDNSKLGYVRIAYEDYTTDYPINITYVSQYLYKVNFTVYIGGKLNGIMLLSKDKQTIYDQFMIDSEVGKTYSIERSITIGG